MAVRKKSVVQPTERHNATFAELTNSSRYQDEKLESDEEHRLNRLAAIAVRGRVTKEWAKGILAFPVVIAGTALGWSVLKSSGFVYWFGTISGLVIMSVGMAYAVEFIKLLISGDLTKATVVLMKGFEMKEWMRVFLAFLSIGAGICFALRAEELTYYIAEWMSYCIGIVLIAGGITYFWTRSKFYKG
jgi:hypothetical protein